MRLEDTEFQEKMDELAADFTELKKEITKVRQKGYAQTEIISMSEKFFRMCDEVTGVAERYSQKRATALDHLEKIVVADIVGLVLLIGAELLRALRYAAQNRILRKKVYLDESTGLPNKNKCEEILSDPTPLGEEESTAICVFDLNNLRIINNNLGHDKGDEYIRSFAEQLRLAVRSGKLCRQGRGDEFIAIFQKTDHSKMRETLKKDPRTDGNLLCKTPGDADQLCGRVRNLSGLCRCRPSGNCSGWQIKTCTWTKTGQRSRKRHENSRKPMKLLEIGSKKEKIPFFGLSVL